MKFEVVLPALIAFVISAVLSPIVIPFLHKLKFGQYIRDEGPEAHKKKSGTPTMGGLIFVASVTVTSIIFAGSHPQILAVLFATIGFAVVGFIDDYLKVVKKQNEGFNPIQKLIGQFIITLVFLYLMIGVFHIDTSMLIPFTGGFENGIYIHFPIWLYAIFMEFVFLGTSNGTNFTDGLDGLLSSVTVVVALFLTFASVTSGAGIGPVTAGMVGALLGFLLFNVYPAKIFMGDTGSLGIGGFVAAAATLMHMQWFILLFGLIYLVEVISVMIQVAYFKKTHGKRFFRMAPIHHHFELGGWPETKVVAIFTIVTAILCLISMLAM